GIDGSRVEKVMELVHIAANKNTVSEDASSMVPVGKEAKTKNQLVRLALPGLLDMWRPVRVSPIVDELVPIYECPMDEMRVIKDGPDLGLSVSKSNQVFQALPIG
ncbi:hypothetical protein MKW92_018777, partial [Papaver armeniacum]